MLTGIVAGLAVELLSVVDVDDAEAEDPGVDLEPDDAFMVAVVVIVTETVVMVVVDMLPKAAVGKSKPNLKVGRERSLIIIEICMSIAP